MIQENMASCYCHAKVCFMTLIQLSTSSRDLIGPIPYQNCLNQVHDHLLWTALDKWCGKCLIWDENRKIDSEETLHLILLYSRVCLDAQPKVLFYWWSDLFMIWYLTLCVCVFTGGEATGVLCGEPSAPLRRCQPAIVYDNGTPANSLVSSRARFMSVIWM